ncbi:MAG: hypothetical protein JW811_04055 [Clostridiales bacterium]|nr:hypothetical protein [Clostridiales bacterium]
MQKALKPAPVLYFLFLLLATAVSAVFIYRGFHFAVSGPAVWFFLNLAVEGALTALCVLGRKKAPKPMKIIALFLPLLALLYFLATRLLLVGVSTLLIAAHGLLCFLSCFILSLSYTNPRVARIVSGVINGVLFLVLLYVSAATVFFTMFSLKFDNSMVIRQVKSPEKSYTAILSSVNQGVLGRYSLVDVEYDYSMIDLGFGRFQKTARLYAGEGNEYTTIRLEWEDDHTLLINGEAYAVE